METLKAIARRKSTRGFKPDPVNDEQIEILLEAANAAPVGMAAFEKVHLSVVSDRALIEKISSVSVKVTNREDHDIFYGAPLVIIIASADYPLEGLDYANAGCIGQNIQLAATDIGLGSVYIFGANPGFAADADLRTEIGIPEGFHVTTTVAIGKPNSETAASEKVSRNISVKRV